MIFKSLARMFHELLSRDREDGRATGGTIADLGMKTKDTLLMNDYVSST